jgi:hypothetical protein
LGCESVVLGGFQGFASGNLAGDEDASHFKAVEAIAITPNASKTVTMISQSTALGIVAPPNVQGH